jgi:hypothetical protein
VNESKLLLVIVLSGGLSALVSVSMLYWAPRFIGLERATGIAISWWCLLSLGTGVIAGLGLAPGLAWILPIWIVPFIAATVTGIMFSLGIGAANILHRFLR